MVFKYAVVMHSRWSEEEEPKATVIRSSDSWVWDDVCTCSPDYALEVAEALDVAQSLTGVREAGDALEDFIRYRMSHDNWTTADRDEAAAILGAWEKARYA